MLFRLITVLCQSARCAVVTFPSHFSDCWRALTQVSWHTLQEPHLNLCIWTILGETHLAAISCKTISPLAIAMQYLHYAKQSHQSGWYMYCMQAPAVVREIPLLFHIHGGVYLPRALAAALHSYLAYTELCRHITNISIKDYLCNHLVLFLLI